MQNGAVFDKARYLRELKKSGPLTREYLEAIDAAWDETSHAVREAMAVFPRFLPFSRKRRALIFKRLCLRLDRLLNRKELSFDNLGTVFIKLELFDRRFRKISNAGLEDYIRNEYLWRGLSPAASEFFSLNEPSVEVLRGGRGHGSGSLYLLAALMALMSQSISGSLSTAWEYVFSDLDGAVTGVIVKSGPGWYERRSKGSYDIRYAYTVDGWSYVGNQVDFDSRIVDAKRKIEKYPEGRAVTVYYDPAQPYYSVLEKKPLGKGIYIQLCGIAGFFLLVYFSGVIGGYAADKSAEYEYGARKKFVYRIPVVYRVFFAGIPGVAALAEQGYLGDFIPGAPLYEPLFTIAFVAVGLIMAVSPYKDSHLEFHEEHLVLPSLFMPPFRKRKIRYDDIVGIKESTDENGHAKLKLALRRGKAGISSHYCYDRTMLTFGSPDEYHDIRALLKERLPVHLASRLE